MGKPEQTPQQMERRLKAYEVYAKGVLDSGQRASLRGIAQSLGVTQTTVRYWRDKDKWEERVDAALQHKTIETTKDNVAVENLMRSGFYRAVRRLQVIIEDKNQKPSTTVRAVLAYGKLCKDFDVIRSTDLKQIPDTTMGVFQDDLPTRGTQDAPIPGGRRGEEETPRGATSALPNPESQPGPQRDGLDRGESGNRARPLLEGGRVPSSPDEWPSPEEASPREWDGDRAVRGDPTNDIVLLNPDDDEIIQAKCPSCGRFWDGLQCESCRLGVNSRDPIPHDEEE